MTRVMQKGKGLNAALAEHEVTDALRSDMADLVRQLAAGLTLKEDEALRDWLRGEAGVGALDTVSVRVGLQGSWAELRGGETHCVRAPSGQDPTLDLFERLRHDPSVRSKFNAAGRRVGADERASRMLQTFFRRGVDPTGAQIADLLAWSPMLDHLAYRFSARCIQVLHDLRRQLLPQIVKPPKSLRPKLLTYWKLALASGHLSLLAASPDARTWLNDMADSFTWVGWTPSMPFVQERSIWFCAIGARHAATFGERVVERYLRAMSLATHPLRVFDAAVGLAAIGLDDPRLIPQLRNELDQQGRRFARGGGQYGQLHADVVQSALSCLEDPDASERAFAADPASSSLRVNQEAGLLSRPAIQLDMTIPLGSHGYVGLQGLPSFMRMTHAGLYPKQAQPPAVSALGAPEIAGHLARAWAPATGRRATIH